MMKDQLKKKKTLKLAVWLLIGFLLVLALAWGLATPPLPVEVAVLKLGPLKTLIHDEGVTRVKDRYLISAPVSGYVRRIDAHVGDGVTKGQMLTHLESMPPAVLDPRQRAQAQARVGAAQATLESAQATVKAAKAEVERAEQAYARQQVLDQEGFVAKAQIEAALTEQVSATAALRTAHFSVDIARYELAAANTLLQFWAKGDVTGASEVVPITSPVDGSVLKVYRQSEGVIMQGQPLLEVGDLSALEVSVDVLSSDAVSISPGMAVLVERWGEVPINGIVRTVEPVGFTKVSALGVEEQRVWVIVDLVSPREQWLRLGDGYRVEASFVVWTADSVLSVPNSSLFRRDGQWHVFTVESGRAEARAVDIGQRSSFETQVQSGLREGEQVIRFPNERLEVGMRVQSRL